MALKREPMPLFATILLLVDGTLSAPFDTSNERQFLALCYLQLVEKLIYEQKIFQLLPDYVLPYKGWLL
jgi:hypothetical protein